MFVRQGHSFNVVTRRQLQTDKCRKKGVLFLERQPNHARGTMPGKGDIIVTGNQTRPCLQSANGLHNLAV